MCITPTIEGRIETRLVASWRACVYNLQGIVDLPDRGMNRSSQNGRSVLFVRHGQKRGPDIRLRSLRPDYFDPFLDDLARFDADLRGRIETWSTNEDLPSLDRVAAVVFLLQDPLAQQFPECFAESCAIANEARDRGIHVVNPPEALSRTKSEQTLLWQKAGVSTPEVRSYADRGDLLEVASGMEFPVLLKHDLLHVQSGMMKIESLDDLRRQPVATLPSPGLICQFIDVRSEYQRTDPDSPFAHYFHKKRALIFGGHLTTNHLFLSSQPIVGFKTSTFRSGRSLNPFRRWWETCRYAEHVDLDWDYWASRTEHEADLLTAARALELDFLAIDYSTRANGSCLLWEANPHFALHLWPIAIHSRRRRLKIRVHRQHRVLADYLRELLEQ